ncbi:hypothetical protein HK097_002860 [Rhizophlyctis rosea]|uniref:Large-conductance mechanosensitive channel n=1 Tax=Rhizophlyctis rosea TaxID=64517 RepID=A0AAD5S314_9FUNG|nr:hypothetical protein HK097_002860 [Rhizophlyctis rosea]
MSNNQEHEPLLNRARRLSGSAGNTARSTWSDFREFIHRGNAVDLAIGVVIGAAFSKIVNSIVDDLLFPVLSLFIGQQLEHAFLILRGADLNSERCQKEDYAEMCKNPKTIDEAHTVGAVTWNWGHFIQALVNFFIISLLLFFIIKGYTATTHRKSKFLKKLKECPYCLEDVPLKALKCKFCGSEQPPAEHSA